MTTPLTYGLTNPVTGDKGSVFFPVIEENFSDIDAHNHEGGTAPYSGRKLSSNALNLTTQSLLAGAWLPVAGKLGLYYQAVLIPNGMLFANKLPFFRETVTGNPLLLSCERVDATHFNVFINDSSLAVTVTYL
jgi:hypothetical protein